jgi:hypothetical protein
MEGSHGFRATGTHDPHAQARKRLQRSELRVYPSDLRAGDSLEVSLEFFYQGGPLLVDLFVGIRCPDGVVRFLPDFEEYPEPLMTYCEFIEDRSPMRFNVIDQIPNCFKAAGKYQICAALFESGSNPNLVSNCYWSETKTIIFND